MRQKSKNFIVNYELYPFGVMVSFGETDEQLWASLSKALPESDIHEGAKNAIKMNPSNKGRFVIFEGGQSLIRLVDYPQTPKLKGVLAHEVFHAVEFLFDRIGIKYHIDKSSEAYAYAIQYLTCRVLKTCGISQGNLVGIE